MAKRYFLNLTYVESDRCLSGPQGSLSLRPKLATVLELFLNQKNRVIPKEQFFAKCWPGTHVEERALAQVLSELRQAIDQVGGDKSCIETIPKKGYRLHVPITPTDPLTTTLVRNPKPIERVRPTKIPYKGLILLVLLGFILGVFLFKKDPTQALNPGKIAILPVQNLDLDPQWSWLALAIPDQLTYAMNNLGYECIPFPEVYREYLRLEDHPQKRALLGKSLGAPIFITCQLKKKKTAFVFEFFIDSAEPVQFEVQVKDPQACIEAVANRINLELGTNPPPPSFSAPYLDETYAKGLKLFLADDFEKAIPFLEVCFSEEPDHPTAGLILAKSYIQKNDFAKAEELISFMAGRDPFEVSMLAAELAFQKRDFQLCEENLSQIWDNPGASPWLNARAHSLAGTVFVRTNRQQEGFDHYRRAEQIYAEKQYFKGKISVVFNRLRAQQFAGLTTRLEDWQQLIDECSIIDNSFLKAHALMGAGDFHFYQSHYAEAYSHYTGSLNLRTSLKDERGIGACQAALGSTALRLGQWREAGGFLQAALEINLKNQDSYNAINQFIELAQVEIALKNFLEAELKLNKAMELAKTNQDNDGVQYAGLGLVQLNLAQDQVQVAHSRLQELKAEATENRRIQASQFLYEAVIAYLDKDPAKAVLLVHQAKALLPENEWNTNKQAYLDLYQKAVLLDTFPALPYTQNPLYTPDF
ncbi:MAG: winged helix-turn-helix domain-containing protein [Acidobacteria bacterium]|nr:winged helix-turn-helix domain-containing protein [Acidobacteriota bacterium]MCB9397911.1 winged helix-turn-helix domain-containing protein [Acidobacteriota bacterium]